MTDACRIRRGLGRDVLSCSNQKRGKGFGFGSHSARVCQPVPPFLRRLQPLANCRSDVGGTGLGQPKTRVYPVFYYLPAGRRLYASNGLS